MTPSAQTETAERDRCPYDELYIYYLKGRVTGFPEPRECGFIGNWQEEEDAFFFFHQPADAFIEALLLRQPHLSFQDHYRMSYEAWQGGPLLAFTAGRLHVRPPWQTGAVQPAGTSCILLDPGVVFGTGTHPTTRDCLQAIELAFAHQTVETTLDLGTGTGLLALAAARLGAARVLALDLNHLAARTARHNVILNGLEQRVLVVQGDAKNYIDSASDLMVSNIHYEVMRPMVEAPAFRCHKQFVLSGLLRSQAREIERRLAGRAIGILRKWERDGIWTTFWGQNG